MPLLQKRLVSEFFLLGLLFAIWRSISSIAKHISTLRQSAYGFYMIILSLLSLSVVLCEGNRPVSRYAC